MRIEFKDLCPGGRGLLSRDEDYRRWQECGYGESDVVLRDIVKSKAVTGSEIAALMGLSKEYAMRRFINPAVSEKNVRWFNIVGDPAFDGKRTYYVREDVEGIINKYLLKKKKKAKNG